jgi:hypothetical protein
MNSEGVGFIFICIFIFILFIFLIVTVALLFSPKKLSKLNEPCHTILDCESDLICSKSICKTKVGFPCKTTSDCVLHFIGETSCINGFCQSSSEIQKKEEIYSSIRSQIYQASLAKGYPIKINDTEILVKNPPIDIVEYQNDTYTHSKENKKSVIRSLTTGNELKVCTNDFEHIYVAGNILLYKKNNKFYNSSTCQPISSFDNFTDIQTSSDKNHIYLTSNNQLVIFTNDGTGKYVESKVISNGKLLNKNYRIYKVGNDVYDINGNLLFTIEDGNDVKFVSVQGNDYILYNSDRDTYSIGEIEK